jgi:hypothetical protein
MDRTAVRPGVRMLTTFGAVVLVAQGVAAAATEQNTKYAGSTGDALSDGLLAAGLLLTLGGSKRYGACSAAGWRRSRWWGSSPC